MLSDIRGMDRVKDMKKVVNMAKSVLEKNFNNHKLCDIKWCYSLQEKEKKRTLTQEHRYLTKSKHRETYTQLQIVLEKFMSTESLRESMHDMTTQKNEALNIAIAWLCPKFKHLSSTMTLTTWICTVICINNMGYDMFYEKLLEEIIETKVRLKIPGLKQISMRRTKESALKTTPKCKRKRVHNRNAKSREEVLEDRLTKRNKKGDYGTGIHFSPVEK